MSRYEPDEPTPSFTEDPDEAGDRDWHDKQDELELERSHPYTIDYSADRFETYQAAAFAAASKVAQLKRSIAIYNRGECIDLRRF